MRGISGFRSVLSKLGFSPQSRKGLSSRQEPSVTAGRSLFSPLPPAFAMVPQYLFHIPVETPAPLGTRQAAFPYIRLFGESFSVPPLYDTGSGLCGAWVGATPHRLRPA